MRELGQVKVIRGSKKKDNFMILYGILPDVDGGIFLDAGYHDKNNFDS